MSGQELVLNYLRDRMVIAWVNEDLEEAQSFNRYFDAIDGMDDIGYNETHKEAPDLRGNIK